MEGTPAIYLGRIIDKKYFRAVIYGANGEKKLVESWNEFEASMQSGLWFATNKDAMASKAIGILDEKPKPKNKNKSNPKPRRMSQVEKVEDDQDLKDVLPDDESVFEVIDGA